MRAKIAAGLLGLLASCANLEFQRHTPTSGTFESKAFALTLLGFDFPTHALDAARENAADAHLPNTVALEERVIPYLGRLDFLLDIVMIRYAKVEGTWGFPTPRE